MTILTVDEVINRDSHVLGDNVYLGNGQGCGTIWFSTFSQARKALQQDGILTGRDLVDCTKCSCHYSYGTEEWKKYPEYLCHKAKELYTIKFC